MRLRSDYEPSLAAAPSQGAMAARALLLVLLTGAVLANEEANVNVLRAGTNMHQHHEAIRAEMHRMMAEGESDDPIALASRKAHNSELEVSAGHERSMDEYIRDSQE